MTVICLIIALLVAAVFVAFTHSEWLLLSALPASLILNIIAWKSFAKSMRALIPVTVFVALISALQWFHQGIHFEIAVKILVVYWLTASAFRLIPWKSFGNILRPGSPFAVPTLYLLFMRHFALILAGESKRLLTARSRSVFRSCGRWSFRSLIAALGSLFLRAMNRAERFYAAQLLKGF
jgi:hypothetical protein